MFYVKELYLLHFHHARKCLNHPDTCCYLCEMTFISQRQNVIPFITKCCEIYFGWKEGDQHKKLGPSYLLHNVCEASLAWVNGSHQMPFTVPMVWREPKDYSSDCYFCLTYIIRITSKSKHTVKYPYLLSAMRHVPHSKELPPENLTFSDESSDSEKITDNKRTMLNVIWHLKQVVPHLNPFISTRRS